ncbi:MAG: flagellin FliC [Alphaproteobacteria bacterium]|nr:MAG: flagellin FliC [Alphaproteobacteria bacterium]
MRVSTNVRSMIAQRYVQQHTEEQAREDMKLSSGERIVRSADDPAGLAISEKMKSIIRSNSQAERNSNDSISLLQVAEGSLNTMQAISTRLRELSMQSASDTVSDMDRAIIDKEFQQMKGEVKRITASTSFNGNNIIKDKDSVYDLQIGVNADKNLDRIHYDMGKIMDSSNNFGIEHINLRSKESSQQSLGALDKMISEISGSRAKLGSMSNRMNSVIQNLQTSRENLSESNSKIRDADIAKEAAIKAKTSIAQSASMALLKMSNDEPGAILKLIG